MQPDIDLFAVGQFRGLSFRTHVEADDDGVRSRSQQHVGFGDGADAGMQDADLDLVGAQLVQHFAERFLRALDVAFQNQRHFLDFAFCQAACAADPASGVKSLPGDVAQLVLAELGHLPGLVVVGDALEGISRQRQALQSQHFDRSRWSGFFHRCAVLVEHRAHFAVHRAGNEIVADLQRSVLYQHGCDVAAARDRSWLRERCPWPAGSGSAFRVLNVGHKQNHFEQQVQVLSRSCRNLDHDLIAAPVFGKQSADRRVRV